MPRLASVDPYCNGTCSSYGGYYDVYLIFTYDTRHGFAGHLYNALVQSEVKVCEQNVVRIKDSIENPRIAIVVFSQGCLSAPWYLDEVANIMECRKSRGLIVLPVFYHVDPIDLRSQTGRYGDAFESHQKLHSDKVERWKIALTEAAQLSGFTTNDGNEALLIQEIVRDVLSRQPLDDMPFRVPANLVGIDSHLEAIYECLDMDRCEVRMVALCGVGGIGKTTIAKTIFNEIGRYFKYKGFLANVRETCQDPTSHGLLKLQQGLLSQMGMNVEIRNVYEGSDKIRQRCCSSRTLLVVDDVDHPQQLEKLAGASHWFGPGSRIIVTTRNKRLLNDREEIRLHEVPLLRDLDAYRLFRQTFFLAILEDFPHQDLVFEILHYMRGLPLAIRVVAANLRGKNRCEWESTLKALKRIPDEESADILELSYADLNRFEKDTLLDIACFFKGQPFGYVRNILECCEFLPEFVIGVLMYRNLISIKYDKIDMHDMIQEMGRKIVRRQSPKDPGKCSRLWFQDSILEVLTEDTGTDKIEGIKLETVATREVKFSANALRRMRQLRVFMANDLYPSGNPINFPKQLRWLEWRRYPFPSLPLHENDNTELVGLYLSSSCVRLLEDDLKPFTNLKFINFSYCASLRKIPNLSSLFHLESLDAEECKELIEVHQSLGLLERLVHLNFQKCNKLRTFPITLNSKVLQNLLLKGCLKLSKFPEVLVKMENLKKLCLNETAIDELPSSLQNLIGLKELYLENCKKLKTLPSSIYRSQSLQGVFLSGCSALGEFPEHRDGLNCSLPALIYLDLQRCNVRDIDFLKYLGCKTSLESLDLSGTKLRTVPKCMEKFVALKQLNLENCKQLQDIQGFPPNVNYLTTKGCVSLEWHVPLSATLKSQLEESPQLSQVDFPAKLKSPLEKSPRVRQIDFSGCCKLTQKVSTSANFFSIEDLLVDSQIRILYPGSKIPMWFDHQMTERSLNFSVDSELYQNIAGLAFCVIIGSGDQKTASLSCEIHVYNSNQKIYHVADIFRSLEMDHMWLVYVPCTMLWGWENKTQVCNELQVLFKLSRDNLKCCGAHLVLKED